MQIIAATQKEEIRNPITTEIIIIRTVGGTSELLVELYDVKS